MTGRFGRWRNANRGRSPSHAAAEQEISDLLRRARESAADPDAAAALGRQALTLIQELRIADPSDPLHVQMLGSTGYQLGASLAAAGRFPEAVDALTTAETAYLDLPDTSPDRDGWVADVRSRRAVALAVHGRGASAIDDVQLAVTAWRRLVADGSDVLDLARVLAQAADVLAVHGDPDLAVAAADHAIREYLRQSTRIAMSGASAAHSPYLLRACVVAIAVHSANDRPQAAAAAEEILRGAVQGRLPARLTPETLATVLPTALGTRIRSGHAPDLTLTLASALLHAAPDAQGQRLRRKLTRPATDVALLIPADRTPAATAHVPALELAELTHTVAGDDAHTALRFGLEAHHLFTWASEQQTTTMRYQLGTVGPPWARALLRSSQLADRLGDLVLAEDLTSWAGAVATRLLPFALVDIGARAAARDSLQAHGALLQRLGEHARAEEALATARQLADLP